MRAPQGKGRRSVRRRSDEDVEGALGRCEDDAPKQAENITAGSQQAAGIGTTRRASDIGATSPKATKRQRAPTVFQRALRGEDGYCPGEIMAIELEFFMSYDYVRCRAAPGLNYVLGPNGSGKSSLTCAIGLGLAGEPKLLGRSSALKDFVQRGKPWAKTSITLRGQSNGAQHKVVRKLTSENASEWWLDDRPAKQKDVKALVQSFNIQVGNLTQFLPQERVSQFAKLNRKELLRETERAVGDPSIPQQHDALIEKTATTQSLKLTIAEEEAELHRREAQNKELEPDVARVEVREQKLEEKRIMDSKLPWLVFSKAQSELVAHAKALEEAEEKLEELTSSQEAENAPYRAAEDEHSLLINELKAKEGAIGDLDKLLQSSTAKDEQLVRLMRSKQNEVERGRQEAENQAALRERAAKSLADAEADFATTPVPQQPVAEMKKLNIAINKLREGHQEKLMEAKTAQGKVLAKQAQVTALTSRVKNMESLHFRRVTALRDNEVSKAWNQLQSQTHRFRGRVYGPIAAEIVCKDSAVVSPLEQHVPNWLWKSFVTTFPEDRDLLNRETRANVVCVDPDAQPPPSSTVTQQMQMLGVRTTLADAFDAPVPVKSALLVQASVHRSFYGTSKAEDNFDAMPGVGITDLYTPRSHFRSTQSLYGNRFVSQSVDAVRNAKFLTAESGHDGELEELKKMIGELQREIQDCQSIKEQREQEARALQNDAAELERERADVTAVYTAMKKARDNKACTVEQRRKTLQTLPGAEDPTVLEECLRRDISEANEERFEQILRVQEYMLQKGRLQMELAAVVFAEAEAYAEMELLKNKLERSKRAARDVEKEHEKVRNAHEKALKKLREAKAKAVEVYDFQRAPDRDEMTRKWEELPDTVEDLQEAIEEKQAEADENLCCNPSAVSEYRARQMEIEAMTVQLETDNAKLLALNEEIADLKAAWLPRLRDLVARISESFSRNFTEMAVAGEVVLEEKDLEFEEYGIQILVQFRDGGQLQPLSETHQSGGERSVATITYLVSLQNLTQCPFRVVDEINQGMDPINECKMHNQLVRANSQPGTAQCFVITPKLLPGLDYGECTTILTVMNGPWVDDDAEEVFKNGDPLSVALQRISE